ncbi:MAG: MiaB/RimO family radical SAM methylthiotransferase [Anaerolineales bacterium]|nr:MiaB/RimO family radical SAM methylthiotransferase [Anaerolineales bacterium]
MKIYLDSVGCRLNQSEIERYGRQFRAAGHMLVDDARLADMVVVNTCSVTAAAASDSRQKIRQAARRLGSAENRQIIVTGCWSSLNPEEALALPGVSRVIENAHKDQLAPIVLQRPAGDLDLEYTVRTPLPGARLRTRAFIKAQDGCNEHCTYCITRLARGLAHSLSTSEILADIRAACQGGAQEIVLTGVQLGAWGADLEPAQSLKALVQEALAKSQVPRLRLSSVEPWNLDEDFFNLWENPRLCRHLHLPLQSGCPTTLRRMARKTTPEHYASLVEAARAAIPDLAVTTDIIVGFPGESDSEFAESLAFVRQMSFADGHVFTYSARPGTPAARMPDQIPHSVRKERNAAMRQVFKQAAQAYQSRFVGQQMEVLWESVNAQGEQDWALSGLTGNYLRIAARASTPLWNKITPVRLTRQLPDGLYGEILFTPA